MKKYLYPAFVFGVLTIGQSQAHADQGDWLVRIRALDIQPRNQSDPIPALGVPANAITLNNKWAPEIDLSYFLLNNIALELILTYPQRHDVSLNGAKIGTAKHLPPTLTVQYHFIPDGKFRPYLGGGSTIRIFPTSISVCPAWGNWIWAGVAGAAHSRRVSMWKWAKTNSSISTSRKSISALT